MAERKVRNGRFSRVEVAVTNATAVEKGNVAAIDTATGKLVNLSETTGLYAIGYFDKSMTGDGTTKCPVTLFSEVTVQAFASDATDPPVAATIGSIVYLEASNAVSIDATGTSVAGRLWKLDTDGTCWVQMLMSGGAAS